MSSTNKLEELKKICKKYQNKGCVYKIANDTLSKKDNVTSKWLVVMRKCHDTVTNESRELVINKNYAKYRADKLKVIAIFNTRKPTLRKKYIVNHNNINAQKTKYTVGSVVECHEFDYDIHEVCSGGIHYFKKLEPAYFYGNLPKKYTGKWISWYNNGRIREENNYVNGEYEGVSTTWYENGKKQDRIDYVNGTEEGDFTTWYMSEKIHKIGNYLNGNENGLWIEWHENGQTNTKGNYFNGKKEEEWTTWYMSGQIHKRGNYLNGKENGLWIEWHENGKEKYKGCYKKGKKYGLWEEWCENGRIKSKGNYINGFKDGMWDEYYDNGWKEDYEGMYMTRAGRQVIYRNGRMIRHGKNV